MLRVSRPLRVHHTLLLELTETLLRRNRQTSLSRGIRFTAPSCSSILMPGRPADCQ